MEVRNGVKFLGLCMEKDFRFVKQLLNKKLNKHGYLIRNLTRILNTDALVSYYSAEVKSRLIYSLSL